MCEWAISVHVVIVNWWLATPTRVLHCVTFNHRNHKLIDQASRNLTIMSLKVFGPIADISPTLDTFMAIKPALELSHPINNYQS